MHQPRIEVIFWDVGGTLVDFATTVPISVRRRLARAGVDATHLSDQQIEASCTSFLAGETTWTSLEQERAATEQWTNELVASMPLSPKQRELAIAELWRYEELYRCVPGILQLLVELRELSIRQAVVSNWSPSLPRFLQYHQLTDFFEAVIYSAQDGIHKPDQRIYRRALSALDVAPENTLFIGDNIEWDVEGPRHAGMRAIHFDPRRQHPASDADTVATLRERLHQLI